MGIIIQNKKDAQLLVNSGSYRMSRGNIGGSLCWDLKIFFSLFFPYWSYYKNQLCRPELREGSVGGDKIRLNEPDFVLICWRQGSCSRLRIAEKEKKKLTVASPVNLPWQVDFSPYVPGILMRVTASVPNSEGQKRILLLHKKWDSK